MIPVSTLPVSFDPYVRLGWHLVPIPPGSKGPINAGWNLKENCVTDPNRIPVGFGVGLAHAYSGTCALDIDDLFGTSMLLSQHGIDLQALLDAPDAVQIISGSAGHAKLLYTLPFGMTLPSRKISEKVGNVQKTIYELRCGTSNGATVQDVLPPSIHPVTCRPYTWGGRGHWERVPEIPTALLDLWNSLIAKDAERSIVTRTLDTSWDEIKSALYAIPANCSRDQWIITGMALQYAGSTTDQLEQALTLWDEWSATAPDKYKGPKDITSCWKSFKPDPAGIKLGSLFQLAKSYGWVKPIPDVSILFANKPPATPEQVMDVLTLEIQPPKVNPDLFPPVIANYAKFVSESRGCDVVAPLFAGLVAVSGAVDARIRLELNPTWKVPPILWVATIGEPSDKKSAASDPMLDPLETIENEDGPRYRSAHVLWQAEEARHSAAKKALFDHVSNASNMVSNTVIPTVPDLGPEPKPLRLRIKNTTSQALVRIAVGNPQGMVYYLDEMSDFLRNTSSKTSSEQRSSYITAYNVGSTSMDRVTAGSIHVENFAVSIYGSLQPTVFREFIKTASSDGLFQRFIPIAVPQASNRKGKYMPDKSLELEYDLMLRKLRTIPKTNLYQLSPEAYKIWDEFEDYYYHLNNLEKLCGSPALYMTALGKVEGTCARIALLMHLAESPEQLYVSEQTMLNAVTLVKKFIIPSLRHCLIDIVAGTSPDKWVADWITVRYDQPSFILREVKSSAKQIFSERVNDADLLEVLHQLEACNWITLIDSEPKRNSYTWAINPLVGQMFPDHVSRIRNAKQELRNLMLDDMEIAKDDPRRLIGPWSRYLPKT